jgi:hypothetical protein
MAGVPGEPDWKIKTANCSCNGDPGSDDGLVRHAHIVTGDYYNGGLALSAPCAGRPKSDRPRGVRGFRSLGLRALVEQARQGSPLRRIR